MKTDSLSTRVLLILTSYSKHVVVVRTGQLLQVFSGLQPLHTLQKCFFKPFSWHLLIFLSLTNCPPFCFILFTNASTAMKISSCPVHSPMERWSSVHPSIPVNSRSANIFSTWWCGTKGELAATPNTFT